MLAMELLRKSSAIKKQANEKLVPINDELSFVAQNAWEGREADDPPRVISAITCGDGDAAAPVLCLYSNPDDLAKGRPSFVLKESDAMSFGEWIVAMFAQPVVDEEEPA